MPVKYSKLETIRYIRSDTPDCAAVFLCAVRAPDGIDEILMQFDGQQWSRMDNGLAWKYPVLGFIGPIERVDKRFVDAVAIKPKEDVLDV